MNRISTIGVASSLAITVGLLYSLCGAVVAIAPNSLGTALAIITHGLNTIVLTQSVAPMSLPRFLLGLVAVMAYSFVAGFLYVLVQNMIAKRSSN